MSLAYSAVRGSGSRQIPEVHRNLCKALMFAEFFEKLNQLKR